MEADRQNLDIFICPIRNGQAGILSLAVFDNEIAKLIDDRGLVRIFHTGKSRVLVAAVLQQLFVAEPAVDVVQIKLWLLT